MAYGFANAYTTTLSGSLTSGATSLTASSDLPSALVPPFRIRIDNEYLEVTAASGTGNRTWTVTRAVEESSRFPAAAHADGAAVNHVLTGEALRDFQVAPFARVFNSASQSITSSTFTILTFDSERDDSDGFHSTSSNTGRLTVPTGMDGVYIIGASVAWASNTTGKRSVAIQVNGATQICNSEITASGTARKHVVSTGYRLVAGDYVEVEVWQNSGGALDVTVDERNSNFWLVRIGD